MAYTLIDNATLIDGTGSDPLKNAAVLIEDGRIKAVGTADSIPLPDAEFTFHPAGVY
jgi:N-acyl-D-aspartate/D-glutamate deacylase